MDNSIIIDKNSLSRYRLKLNLWELGCAVVESDNDFEAINLIMNKRPEVIFLSMEYDKQRFVGLVRLIRKMLNCKIIVYSDRINKEDFIKCYTAAVDDVLIDPCNQASRLRQYFRNPVKKHIQTG